MRCALAVALAFAALSAGHARAEGYVPDVQAIVAAAMAEIVVPSPAVSVPSSEVVAGGVGASTLYARQDHTHPRISRAMTATTVTGGTFTGTWSTALAQAPALILTPVWGGAGVVSCILTSAPTTTTFAGKCVLDNSALLNLGIITTGLTIGPVPAAAGVSVQVIAIPPTQ